MGGAVQVNTALVSDTRPQHAGQPVIDAHAHVFRPADVYPRTCDELAPARRDAPAEDLLAVMRSTGVSHAMLVPLDGDDSYVTDVLAIYPGRFAPVAVLTDVEQGRTVRDPVQALRRRRAQCRFPAVRTGWLGAGRMADSPMLPLLRYLAEHGIVVSSYLPPDQLPLLGEAVRMVPDLLVVLNHLGYPPHDMGVDRYRRPRFGEGLPTTLVDELLRLSEAPNVHLMVSGQYALSTQDPPYADLFAPTRRLASVFGPERLLWASDYPWPREVPGYHTMLDVVADALPTLTATQRGQVLGGTARVLFPGWFTDEAEGS